MRWLCIFVVVMWASVGQANSYHRCVSPLINSVDENAMPHPEHSFRLTFGDTGPPHGFVAQGQAFDGKTFRHLTWHGVWIAHQGDLQMVGDIRVENIPEEWRAGAVFSDASVMIINVDRGDGASPLMIRCLPVEGA